MSSATLCCALRHGMEPWWMTLAYGPKWWDILMRALASRVKRSCASNPERVLHSHCPQTSCVGWEHLLLVAEPVTPA